MPRIFAHSPQQTLFWIKRSCRVFRHIALLALALVLPCGTVFAAANGGAAGQPLKFAPPPVDLEYKGGGVSYGNGTVSPPAGQRQEVAPVPAQPVQQREVAPRRSPAAQSPGGAKKAPVERVKAAPAKATPVKAAPPAVQPPKQSAPAPEPAQETVVPAKTAPVKAAPSAVQPPEQSAPAPEPAQEKAAPLEPAPAQASEASASGSNVPAPKTPSASSYINRKPVRLFGTVEFRSPLKNLPKWDRVRLLERKKPSFTAKGLAAGNKGVAQRWDRLREQLKDASLQEKVKGVNAFFNQWPYKTDREVWGVEDYWATPREFVARSGDCEDYAIAKYYALRDLGVPKEILRIAAIKDQIRNLGHAVLVVFMDDDAYVLDNLTNLVLSHKRLTHYALVYTVNEDFLWRHIKPKPARQ